MKHLIASFGLLIAFAYPLASSAQVAPADSARITAIITEVNAAAKGGDFKKGAGLAKEMIRLGMRDNSTYFSAATMIGLSGAKAEAIPYFDTAATLGFSDENNWQTLTMMLGISKDPEIIRCSELVKHNAADAPAAKPEDVNQQLHALYQADQQERMQLIGSGNTSKISSDAAMKLMSNDSLRRVQTFKMLQSGALRTKLDFYEAAMIFQHGNDTSDFHTAHELAMASVAMGNADAKWLAAATFDRYLVKQGKPQKYGTQSFTDPKTHTQKLYPVDPKTTDAERAEWNVPPLKDALNAVKSVYNLK